VAKASQQSAKLAMDSEIGGVNTTVAQLQAQLDNANWELSQTTIRAPADGYVTVVALTVGDRAFQLRSAMSFIVEKEITLVGIFSQNGFQTIKEGAAVDIVFDNAPGRIYHARITAIPRGIGQGQIAVSGTLARTTALGGATSFPAEISIPDEMSRDSLRLGMSGSATAFAANAGVIGLLASILVWVSSYTAYL
jgi:multidrug resistance efflux pump